MNMPLIHLFLVAFSSLASAVAPKTFIYGSAPVSTYGSSPRCSPNEGTNAGLNICRNECTEACLQPGNPIFCPLFCDQSSPQCFCRPGFCRNTAGVCVPTTTPTGCPINEGTNQNQMCRNSCAERCPNLFSIFCPFFCDKSSPQCFCHPGLCRNTAGVCVKLLS